MAEKYVIWSEEHGAWWAPNASGYTRELAKAGRYEKSVAEEIVTEANKHFDKHGAFHEIAFLDPLHKS